MSDPKILHRQSGGQIAEAFEQLQGPFAFPQMVQLGDRALVEGGLTIRDFFAVHADGLDNETTTSYAEMFAGEPCPINDWAGHARWWAKANAAYRYMQADAMLAEREKGGAA